MDGWNNVTASEPCEICGADRWCSRSDDRSALNCRRQSTSDKYGVGKPHTAADGNRFWTFFTTPKQESSNNFVPALSPSPVKADPDTLHKIYSSVLDRLDYSHPAVQKELTGRGLSNAQNHLLQQHGYRWLPKSGRSRIAREIIKKHGEQAVAGTPGFVLRHGKDNNQPYWILSGKEGMVVPVRDVQGRIVALKTRPPLIGSGKYLYLTSKNKKWNDQGSSPGSPVHVPVSNVSRETIRVTEGELKADIATMFSGVLTIGLPGLGWKKAQSALEQLGAKSVLVSLDRDWRTNPAVLNAVVNLLDNLHLQEFQVSWEIWEPEDGKGIDDVLTAGKPVQRIEDEAEIRKILATAKEKLPQNPNSKQRTDTRAGIQVTPDEHIVVGETLNALATDSNLYKRNGQLVHVIQEASDSDDQGIVRSSGTPRILAMSTGHLRERMTERCFFFKLSAGSEDSEPEEHQCSPPAPIVNAIFTRGFWPQMRNLSGVTEIPVLRPDGTILTSPGWDESTGLLFVPNGELPKLKEHPDQSDAIAAKDLLLDVIADFPFASPAHQSAWLAGMLTILARRAFAGPSPLFLVDANIRGSGKSLLTDVISIIATSRPMPRFSNPESDEETRKRITALALAGDPLVLIDNINGTLGSASLDAVLTSTSWKDRRLGGNEIVEMPMRAVWFGTGNNVILAGDMSRRVCHVRLDSLEENPEERENFRHPKLLAHVRENRMQLLAAGLTILRAFVVAGRPDAGVKPWGSFEGWSDLIRNCLVWIGMDDPGGTRKELAEASDRDAGALRLLFEGWSDIDPKGEGLSAADLVQLLDFHKRRRDYVSGGMEFSVADKLIAKEQEETEAVKTALCELCGVSDLTSKEVRKIGFQLRRFKGRVIGENRLECSPHGRNKVNRWRVKTVNAGDAAHAVYVFPRQKFHLSNESDLNRDIAIENIEQSKTYTASPAYTASTTTNANCPMCGFDSDRPGEECATCRI